MVGRKVGRPPGTSLRDAAVMARAIAEAFPQLQPHTAADWVTLVTAQRFDVTGLLYMSPTGPAFALRLSADTMHASFKSKSKHLAAVSKKLFRSGPFRNRWAALDDVATWRRLIRGFCDSDWPATNSAMAELVDRGWSPLFKELLPRVLAIAAFGGMAPLTEPRDTNEQGQRW